MAMSNRDRVGKGLELLVEGLTDIVDQVMTAELRGADSAADVRKMRLDIQRTVFAE